MDAIASLFRYRHVLFATTVDAVRARYSGTLLGLTWAAAYPFMFLGLYARVYAYGSPTEMIPGPLKLTAYANPFFYVIEMYREILFGGILSPTLFGAFALATAVLFLLGH